MDSPDETIVVEDVKDHHTTPVDVIDNLFLALNKKDWDVVNSYYSPNARIVDITDNNTGRSPADYYKGVFEANDIFYIYLHEQHATNNGIRAKAFTRRGTRSAEYPLCFEFVVLNNRIIEQRTVTCEEK